MKLASVEIARTVEQARMHNTTSLVRAVVACDDDQRVLCEPQGIDLATICPSRSPGDHGSEGRIGLVHRL